MTQIHKTEIVFQNFFPIDRQKRNALLRVNTLSLTSSPILYEELLHLLLHIKQQRQKMILIRLLMKIRLGHRKQIVVVTRVQFRRRLGIFLLRPKPKKQ